MDDGEVYCVYLVLKDYANADMKYLDFEVWQMAGKMNVHAQAKVCTKARHAKMF